MLMQPFPCPFTACKTNVRQGLKLCRNVNLHIEKDARHPSLEMGHLGFFEDNKNKVTRELANMVRFIASVTFFPLQIFVISSKKIQHQGYETLYKYTTRNPKAAVSRYVASVPLQWQVDSLFMKILSRNYT